MNWNDSDFHLPYNRQLVEKAKELRKNMTPAERKLWYDYLRTFKFRVLRQRPIDNFIVDFFCAQLKLVIEVDGESHFTDDGKDYDWERTQILKGYGLKVLRFSNHEVLQDWEGVCRRIEEEIPPTPLQKLCISHIFFNNLESLVKQGFQDRVLPPALTNYHWFLLRKSRAY
jgi:very-short-patch-repair endonuclease